MADRFWVGGTANWDGTAGSKWSDTSGGTGGFSVPTTSDDVFFTDLSTGTCTIASGNAGARSINCTGFTGAITGTEAISVVGSVTLSAGMSYSHTGTMTFLGTGTLTTAGKTIGPVTVNNAAITLTLGDALTCVGNFRVTAGNFITNNYNVTAGALLSTGTSTRSIDLGSSTVNLSSSFTALSFTSSLSFVPGTSTIIVSNSLTTFSGGNKTFSTVNFTATSASRRIINDSNTFGNLSFAGQGSAGVGVVQISSNQVVTGTFTASPGVGPEARTFFQSYAIGSTRTLTCNSFAAGSADVDFRDISIAGAASPISGTRFGDCKGNSGITFDSPKTVFFRSAASANWGGTASWSFTNGGAASSSAFPLAQDTAVFPSSPTPYPSSGNIVTLNASYNIGTIDMSARTSNTMTLDNVSWTSAIYGNWINGTGTSFSGTGTWTFAGRGSQTITSAGRTFTPVISFDSPNGTVTLQDAFISSNSISLISGTFDAANYNITLTSNAGVSSTGNEVRVLAIGSATWIVPRNSDSWTVSGTNLTVTGTGVIRLTGTSAKTFAGGGIQTYPTISQGGAGTLTITGSNKFANITNTVIGRVQFTAGTTNIFDAFNLSGTAGNLLQLGSTTTSQATLQKGSAWQMGANSTNAGNNTGLSFTAGGGIDYLSVSYINGTVVTPANAGNFLFLF